MNHECPLRTKGKTNIVIWAYYEDSDSENLDQQFENEESIEKKEGIDDIGDEKIEGRLKKAHLTSAQQEGSFKMRGVLAGQRVITLLDTGATHNFIDSRLIERRGI